MAKCVAYFVELSGLTYEKTTQTYIYGGKCCRGR
jgi:hypothetical protein